MNYKDQDVFVVGGANSAAQGAIVFESICAQGKSFNSRQTTHRFEISRGRAGENQKIELMRNTDLIEVKGKNSLEQIIVKNTKYK